MKYCSRCILPDTRPNLVIGPSGICNACESWKTKTVIDWEERKRSLAEVFARAKERSTGYDCIIPVSGGKDSHWQVIVALEHGLKPLAVTWKTPVRTAIGSENLQNLINLGVDHIDYQINPKVEKVFMLESLIKHGSPAIPMHMALFSIPLSLAARFEVPLVIWGENSAFEYGGTEEQRQGFLLDSKWLRMFGVTAGTTARDWVSEKLTEKDLTPYYGPSERELAERNIRAIFLGYYLPWDAETALKSARAHGFKERAEGPRTGYWNYADIDDDFISIHHYIKWYKFGFTRLFDNLSIEIRSGRLTREKAIEIVRTIGDQTPHEDIEKFCSYVGITRARFDEILETFRNREIWVKENGRWTIPEFLVPEWNWGA